MNEDPAQKLMRGLAELQQMGKSLGTNKTMATPDTFTVCKFVKAICPEFPDQVMEIGTALTTEGEELKEKIQELENQSEILIARLDLINAALVSLKSLNSIFNLDYLN